MIHILCALKCEAKPLIQHYQFKHRGNTGGITTYLTDDGRLSLTVTGPGKTNIATGVDYVHKLLAAERSDAWLNIGIAGHKNIITGHAILAHSVHDANTADVWFPQIVFEPPCLTGELLTLTAPSSDYTDKMYDMEAAGFFAAASRFSTAEMIHSLKIISDNMEYPTERISGSLVTQYISEQLGIIDRLLNELQGLTSELKAVQRLPEYFQHCIDHWHFTWCERESLKGLLNRWDTLFPGIDPMDQLASMRDGKEVLVSLETTLDKSPICLSASKS